MREKEEEKKMRRKFSLVGRIQFLLDKKREEEMNCCNSHDTLFSHIHIVQK
jgi:hypothetical protein